MADIMTAKERSERMRLIRSRDTKPEWIVRSLLHRMGYRYRLHDKKLPGKPDLVFRSRRKVIFVHGCFWHMHEGCRDGKIPATRQEYWEPKLKKNRQRDLEAQRALEDDGWQVLTVWECEMSGTNDLRDKLVKFLGKRG